MLKNIIGFSVRNKLLIGAGVLLLIVTGIVQFTKLPIDAVPDITNNQVQVITVSPSLGAPDVERLITFPIEQANSNIPGLIEIRSFSRFGLSLVTLVFNDETDVYWARQQVSERLINVKDQIPAGSGVPSLGPVTTGLGEIYQYVLRPKPGYESKYDAMQLRTLQDWIVRRQLLGIKGVADVSSFGGKLKQYEIAIDVNKLSAYKLSINEVFSALNTNNQNTGGAYIEKGPSVLFIRSEGLIQSLEDIGNIVVKESANSSPVFIRDIAAVGFGHAVRYGAMTYNGGDEVAGAVVMMLKGENSNTVIKEVKQKIASIQEILPEGVLIEPFLDRTKMVNNAIGTVQSNLLEGALIVIFVLVLFLGNLRAGLLVASVIPLAMLFAIIMMNVFKVSGNLMSLGALDFGLIVDGAVIIVEAVLHGLQVQAIAQPGIQLSKEQMNLNVKSLASKMMNSAVFGQIIILIVYLPIFSLSGIEGKMFKPMAQTVAFALLGAFLLSLTYVPMMCALFLKSEQVNPKSISEKLMSSLNAFFAKKLAQAMHYSKQLILGSFVLFVLALVVLFQMGGEFIPVLEEGDFAVETRILTGSNLQSSIQIANQASQLLTAKFPEVEKVVAKIGSGEIPTDPMPIEAMDLMVIMKDKSTWKNAKTFPEMSEKMSHELASIPGVNFGFQYPVQMRFNELMTGARQDVVCKIFGEHLDSLANYAKQLGAIVSKVDGAKDIYVEVVTGMPQIVIKYDRQKIAQFGLSVETINTCVNAAFAGQNAGLVFEGEKRFDLVVRLEKEKRNSLDDVRNLLIPNNKGVDIPLYQVANVDLQEGPAQIQREDAKRRIMVGFNVRGRDVQTVVHELQEKVKKQLNLSPGYYVNFGGSFENLEEAQSRLLIAVPVALLLILLMLYLTFGSMVQGLLIFTAIPLSATGGIFALALRGIPFSISAGVGFIALFGVAVLNGIVLISEFNRLKEGSELDIKALILKGTQNRLRPVLMTAFVASLGFLPMALSNGAGAEVQRPLATVVIGGLLFATFLTLFLLPLMYMTVEKKKFKMNSSKAVIALLFGTLFSIGIQAQTPSVMKLSAAIDTALSNNLQFRNDHLYLQYLTAIKKSSLSVPNTSLNVEYGQFNSAFKDNRIGLTQNFQSPLTLVKQHQLAATAIKAHQFQLKWKENELKQAVASSYNLIFLLSKKIHIWNEADSLYQLFLDKEVLRTQLGESAITALTHAQIQKVHAAKEILNLTNNLQSEKLYLQYLLNALTTIEPDTSDWNFQLNEQVFLYNTAFHPKIKEQAQLVQVGLKQYQLEKSKFSPDFQLGIQSVTIQGIGADNQNYGLQTRFNSVQAGLQFPLFFGSQLQQTKAKKIAYKMAQQTLINQTHELANQFKVLLASYQSAKQINQLYSQIQQHKQLIFTSKELFEKGAIDFLDFSLLMGNAITNELEALDAKFQLNQTIIQLNYFQ